MRNTRELILRTSLKLFSQRGFEGVSVRDIAGELELTAPALYVHFKSKQEILDAILSRMERRDFELSGMDDVPQKTIEETPEEYDNVDLSNLSRFTMDMFRYWTEDEFAVQFRHLLTIEQYRDSRFGELYQQYLGGGVVKYLEDIFSRNMEGDSHYLAVSLFSMFHFLLGQYDAVPTKKARKAICRHLEEHLKKIIKK